MTVLEWQSESIDPEQTERLGEMLGNLLRPPEVIELRSDLGGGKTTFARGLLRGLGSKDKVASPTFTISRIYQTPKSEVHHFDFYRLDEAGLIADQLKESLENPNVITVIEWSEIVKGVLPHERYIIELRPLRDSPDERLVIFNYPQSKERLVRKMQVAVAEL